MVVANGALGSNPMRLVSLLGKTRKFCNTSWTATQSPHWTLYKIMAASGWLRVSVT
jgi:hypothetical protein